MLHQISADSLRLYCDKYDHISISTSSIRKARIGLWGRKLLDFLSRIDDGNAILTRKTEVGDLPNSLLKVASAEAYFDLNFSASNQPVRRPKSSAINNFVDAQIPP